eukprot:TRINITY_DN287_c3_g3_i1.p1 TRINITY_DN287_c3_g3~~TRINITY_DN287_c3_g3_i1.p1  ORF type:complete len:400 (+),score=152.64 TRINITY_DN287_c3_g3_i1:44-1243(+)
MAAINNYSLFEFEKKLEFIQPQTTLLLGPGPSNPHPRILAAMGCNTVSHLHRSFVGIMDEVCSMLRFVFQTKNKFSICITGSGAAAMEATCVNLFRPGEVILVGCNGYWGYRYTDVAQRLGLKVIQIEKDWGEVFSFEELKLAVEQHKPAALFLTHGESSTGTYQPLEFVGKMCHENNCLLIVDTVVTLAGMPVLTDEWEIDVVYSGAQKCLSCPPGVSPFTMNNRAIDKMLKCAAISNASSFYLDLILIGKYWGCFETDRIYHHTGSINNIYSIHEALRIVTEQGLLKLWKQHEETADLLYSELNQLGLELLVENKQNRLFPLTTVKVPEGLDAKLIQQHLLNNYNIEIAGGLGKLAGKIWRIGLMGYNAKKENVYALTGALKATLEHFKQNCSTSKL